MAGGRAAASGGRAVEGAHAVAGGGRAAAGEGSPDPSHAPLQRAVLAWYDVHGRDLPWRATRDPYAILVSEVMAQQTQVQRVRAYYERWLARWPTAQTLAAASPAEVLTEWSGLGYNARALRLRETAAIVARDGWPRTAASLRALPGVGPYTAAAVASFAFGERIAAVDTNVRRVAQRLGVEPAQLLPVERHSDFNQAAMELGARVCGARGPRCGECPAARWCPSRGRVVLAKPRAAAGAGARFEDTERWVRGRIVAALAAGEPLPPQIAAARVERALVALERDGLVERRADGVGLPRCIPPSTQSR